MSFETRDPNWLTRALQTFNGAPFVRDVGFRLVDIEPGRIMSELELADRHMQQDGIVHAGVQATMADHTAGTAAATLLSPDQAVLTIEFKVNLFSAARGDKLVCRAEILRPGRHVTFAEASVYAVSEGNEALVSRTSLSFAVVAR